MECEPRTPFHHQWSMQDSDAATHFQLSKNNTQQSKNFNIFFKRWKTEHRVWTNQFQPIIQCYPGSLVKKTKKERQKGKSYFIKMSASWNLGFILINYFFNHTKGWGGKYQHVSSKHYLMPKWKHQEKRTKSNTVCNFPAFHSVTLCLPPAYLIFPPSGIQKSPAALVKCYAG